MFGEGPVKVAGASPTLGVQAANLRAGAVTDSTDGRADTKFGYENSGNLEKDRDSSNYSTLGALNRDSIGSNHSKNQVFESDLKIMDLQRQIENMKQNPRKVIQITIYYDDSTFETFIPKG